MNKTNPFLHNKYFFQYRNAKKSDYTDILNYYMASYRPLTQQGRLCESFRSKYI